jgi:hypothetical protein
MFRVRRGASPSSAGIHPSGVAIPSQNSCNRSRRFSGAFPAMIAPLTLPIEMPATSPA